VNRLKQVVDDPTDVLYMQRALELAREGAGLVSPNPCVGAVVVNENGEIVGEGSHTYAGLKHAEVIALEQAGGDAAGATLYLNLEPCCHTGRTGPCADAVIAAGIARVVAAMEDPNPVVAGKGFEKLRAAGIEVSIGVGEREARRINEAFTKYIRTRLPFVTLKTAMTLDGKIAPPPGESENPSALGTGDAVRGWITSEMARTHVHQLRHENDAIMVGVGTVIADDPLLTDRSGRERRRPLMRVILDSRLRIPLESRIVQTASRDVIVFCTRADEEKARELRSRGVCVEAVDAEPSSGRPDVAKTIARLGEMEITSVMVEGGSSVNWEVMRSGVADRVFLYYAPKILGGKGAVPFAAGKGFERIAEAPQVKILDLHRFGEDFAVEGYLRDPYEKKGK
jgi:diaminohydroxyphosphoribosylaminopyrimidine deaminase / 5-amino-6-(5-phosphoribosylamino)uracil reductase